MQFGLSQIKMISVDQVLLTFDCLLQICHISNGIKEQKNSLRLKPIKTEADAGEPTTTAFLLSMLRSFNGI